MTRTMRLGWTVLVVAAVVGLSSSARAEGSPPARKDTKKMAELFSKGVRSFRRGAYRDATREFEAVLKMNPTSAEALELRDKASSRFFLQAMNKGPARLRDSLLKLLELAAEADKVRITDQARIAKIITQLLGSYEVQTRAYIQLTSAGRYAVPLLVQRLADTEAPDYDDYKVRATVALIRIGEEAVLPLCAALRSDNVLLRQSLCFILGQIADPRAVPYLLRAARADKAPSVRAVAQAALDRMREYTEVPDVPPHVALLAHARLYYYGDPSVERPSRYGHTLWTWAPAEKRLVMHEIPAFLYNIGMARTVAAEALLADPAYEPVLPFLISTYHREVLAIRRRLEISRSDPARKLPELVERQLRARMAKSQNILLTLRSAGEKHFYRALSMQLRDGEPDVAAAVIEDLAVVASPQLNRYTDPPELSEPLRPAVFRLAEVRAKPKPKAEGKKAPVSKKRPALASRSERPGRKQRPARDPFRLFGLKVEAEKKAVEKAVKAVPKPAPGKLSPGERETLMQLIASARLRRARRQAAEAKRRKEEKAREQAEAPSAETNPLVLALRSSDKAVRYGAAAALAHIGPTRSFVGSRAVVEILGQAITEKGVSTVLIVSRDNQAANLLRAAVRSAGHVPYSAASLNAALRTARSLPPKDLILLHADMSDTFAALKKDPAVAGVPVVVFTPDRDTSAAKKMYPKVAGVVSLTAKAEAIQAELGRVILGRRTKMEGMRLSARYARMAARALARIPAAGSPLSVHLPRIKDALIAALDGDDVEVRISAIRTLGKAKVTSLIPRLINICEAADRPKAERRACMTAIGAMMEVGKPAPPAVVALLERIHRSGDVDLRRFAVQELSGAAIPPSAIERLISREEAAPAGP